MSNTNNGKDEKKNGGGGERERDRYQKDPLKARKEEV